MVLYTLPQWGIFVGVATVIYAWVENKKQIIITGDAILVLLGIYAYYALSVGLLTVEFDTTNALQDDDFLAKDLPIEAKLVPMYWGLVITGLLSLIALILEVLGKKLSRIFNVLAIIISLILFFMIYGLIKV